MYLLKIKGKAKIPDFVQIRDNEFTLIAYIKLDNLKSGLEKFGLFQFEQQILRITPEIPYGKIIKLIE